MNTPQRQRGSMAITIAILLIGLISILGLVTVAQYYWAKRDAQKVADLAALSGAQHFSPNCVKAAKDAAYNNAGANWKTDPDRYITPTCGNWNPSVNPPDTYFIAAATTSAPANAIKVVAHVTPDTIIPAEIAGDAFQVKATAIAANLPPVAAFSVGSQLLQLHDSGLLPGLLKLIGVDTDGTALVGPNGLANLRVTPSGLLHALCETQAHLCLGVDTITDIGTLNSVLAGHHVSVGNLIHALAYLATQNKVAQVSIDALNALAVKVQDKSLGPVQLGTATDANTDRGLFAYINTATTKSALDAKVNVLSILNTSLQVANSKHLIDLTNGHLPGVKLLGGVEVYTTVIEPPSIAIGGPGVTAYNAQIRIGIKITTKAIPLVGTVLNLLGTEINIPIIVDLVTGEGVLQGKGPNDDRLCDHDANGAFATIHATSRLLNICISKFNKNTFGSTSAPCEDNLKSAALVKVLHVPLIAGATHISGLDREKYLDLHVGETKSVNVKLDLGQTVKNTLNGVLLLVGGHGQDIPNSSDLITGGTTPTSDALARHMWEHGVKIRDSNGSITRTIDCKKLHDGGPDSSDRITCRNTILNRIKEGAEKAQGNATVTGLLPGLGNLLGGLVGSVGDLLGGILNAVTGQGCASALLGYGGHVDKCIADISGLLAQSQPGGGPSSNNALLAILGPALNLLQPILDTIGQELLQPLIQMLLGTDLGRTDVHLMSLQCQGTQLVY